MGHWGCGDQGTEPFVAVTLTESIPETRGPELGNVYAKPLVLMLVDIRKDLETKTRADKLDDVEAKPLFDNLADTIAEADSETLFLKIRIVPAELLVKTLGGT